MVQVEKDEDMGQDNGDIEDKWKVLGCPFSVQPSETAYR